MSKKIGKEISFHFHPHDWENKNHVIVKDESGSKRRYLAGVSSGLKIDAHGERMTKNCIKSFMDQANSGNVLLYADVHGIKASDDIGILTKAEILFDDNWYTEFRLYDEKDGVGQYKLEKIETIWKQLNGIKPYKKPMQKGFSIEGVIPDEAIVYNSIGDQDRSVIDDVQLDGVVIVPRPAYTDSVATAIYKALGEITPQRQESLRSSLVENLQLEKIENEYYKKRWEYQDALEKTIEKVMTKKNNNKQEELNLIFEEYKNLMIELIVSSASMFVDSQPIDLPTQRIEDNTVLENDKSKVELYKSLVTELKKLEKIL